MIIAVDTRLLLHGKMDGIGWFTRENFARITGRYPEHNFHFIFDRPWHDEFVFGKNIVTHSLSPQARHPLLFKIWYDFRLPMLLRRIKPDLLVCPGPAASLATKVPQLVVLHDLNFEHYPKDLKASHSAYFRKYSKLWAQQAARIATVSEFSKSDIVSTYGISPEKIDVVYNGAGEHFRPLNQNEATQVRATYTTGQPYFVFVSSIHPRKNLQRVLPAFDQFKSDTGLAHKLVVVGHPYQVTPELKAILASMKFRDEVVFTGRLQPAELASVMGAARALVYAGYFEGFGIPIVEAFQSGVPVITASVTAMPEIAGDAALLVDPMSIKEIAGALTRLATDDNLRDDLIARGFERAKLYSWERTSELLWQSMMKAITSASQARQA